MTVATQLEDHKNWLEDNGGPRLDFRGRLIVGEDFSGLDLRFATFANAVFKSCNFNNSKLAGVNCTYAVFEKCIMVNANLDHSNLAGTNFQKCNTKGMTFYNVLTDDDTNLQEQSKC